MCSRGYKIEEWTKTAASLVYVPFLWFVVPLLAKIQFFIIFSRANAPNVTEENTE